MASNVVVADEMFPDGAEASFMDIEEAQILARKDLLGYSGALRETLGKPTPAAHADFDDNFGDLFDDDDVA
ncbi:hypothetical protein EB796_002127 [Bugula neritina]|uniref:Uncharacterized protein n=1 Tax=Bugula neritina TaxID=10212 RepID=A0A7J7KN26_BUGNE|nr:hypothetical protein EB796_002127 [Bugula neritina]